MVEHDKVGVATRHDAAALILDVRRASRHLGCHANGDIGAGDAPVDDVLDALGKREHRAGNALAVGEPAQVVLHDDVHATTGVAALGHAAATQAVGNEHRVLPALGLQQRLDGSRVNVLAVTDDLGVGLGRGHGSAHDTGLTVMQSALAVIGMRKAAGTGVDGSDALIVGGVGVTDAGHHTLGVQSSRISSGTVALGRHGALNDATTRSLLPLIEDLLGGIDKVSGVLRAHVLHGKEGALQVDALNASTAEVGAATLVRLSDGGAGVLDLLDAIGERRGQPAGGTATGELGRADIDALGIIIGS